MCRHHAHPPVPHGPRLKRADSLAHGAAHDHDHAQWTRRDFLINAGLSGAAGALLLAGAPARALAPSPFLDALAGLETDRVLVLIQLAGGNDGLNTVVPVTNDLYYQKRPTLALRSSQTVPLTADFGLHPSMAPLQSRWGAGQLAIVHGVGYPGPDLSHFRGTDIWMTASDGTRPLPAAGWAGRTTEALYPGLDTSPPTDPPAVQIGASTPLLFAGDGGRRAVALTDPALIEGIAESGTIYDPADVPATAYGQELAFIRTIANDSFRYLGAMHAAASQATNSATYPANRFGASLAAAARFIKGGLDTRLYHVVLDGFDTHASQATRQAALLGDLAVALDAFFSDLSTTGNDRRVLAMTFSEFGRRVAENGSGGTDHGTAAPLFLAGPATRGGLHGALPALDDLDASGNLRHTTDFRSVYATALQSWLGVDEATTHSILGGAFPVLPLLDLATDAEPVTVAPALTLGTPTPNPVRGSATVPFTLDAAGPARLEVIDTSGRLVTVLHDAPLGLGEHEVRLDASGLPAGVYVLRLLTSGGARTARMTVAR